MKALFQKFHKKVLFEFKSLIFLSKPLILFFDKFITFFCHMKLINTCFAK